MTGPSPNESATGVATVNIMANGAPLADIIAVVAVDVWLAAGAPPRARLAVLDGNDSDGAFLVSEGDALAPGASLAIAIGWGGATTQVFSGAIQSQHIDIGAESAPQLSVAAVAPVAAVPATILSPVLTLGWGDAIITFKGSINAAPVDDPLIRVNGQVKFVGSTLVAPGSVVSLAGLGARFNGDALVSAVHHSITNGDWITTIQLGAVPRAGDPLVIADSNGNSLTLDRGGIQIKSGGNLGITAEGDVTVTGGMVNVRGGLVTLN